MISQATQFTILPMAGGIYDQHPEYIDAMMFILTEQAREEDREKNKKKNATMGPPGNRPTRSRRVAGH